MNVLMHDLALMLTEPCPQYLQVYKQFGNEVKRNAAIAILLCKQFFTPWMIEGGSDFRRTDSMYLIDNQIST